MSASACMLHPLPVSADPDSPDDDELQLDAGTPSPHGVRSVGAITEEVDFKTLPIADLYEVLVPGKAVRLLERFPNPSLLKGSSVVELSELGLAPEEIWRVAACAELCRRSYAPAGPDSVCGPEDAAPHFFPLLSDSEQERVAVLALNGAHRVITVSEVFVGGMTRAVIDPKVIFSKLLRIGSAAFVLAHNHPSGNLDPSREDISVTEKLLEVGDMLELQLLDHLVLSGERWISLRMERCVRAWGSAYYYTTLP